MSRHGVQFCSGNPINNARQDLLCHLHRVHTQAGRALGNAFLHLFKGYVFLASISFYDLHVLHIAVC